MHILYYGLIERVGSVCVNEAMRIVGGVAFAFDSDRRALLFLHSKSAPQTEDVRDRRS